MSPEEIEQPEHTEQPEQGTPEPAALDPQAAIQLAAQQFGVTPDYLEGAVRLQDENRRQIEYFQKKERELALREAQVEALARERQQFLPREPQYEIDPAVRPLYDTVKSLESRLLERERREEERERNQVKVQQMARELEREYLQVMRGVPSQNQVDQERFFSAMGEIYPTENGQLPPGITPQKAAFFTAKYLGLPIGNGNGGYAPPARNPALDRRAQFVIPGGSTGGPPATPSGFDTGPQRPNETAEQYAMRLHRVLQEMNYRLPDGAKVSSG